MVIALQEILQDVWYSLIILLPQFLIYLIKTYNFYFRNLNLHKINGHSPRQMPAKYKVSFTTKHKNILKWIITTNAL